ncbi:MAG: cell division protein FtsL [bacterium]
MKMRFWVLAVLAVATFLSALGVVVVQHESRTQFRQLQALEKERDQLEMEWGRLELEQGAWTTPSRIESLADKKLDMRMPGMGDTVMVLR